MGHHGGVARNMEIFRSYFAPYAVSAGQQQVMKFTHYRRSDQSINEYFVESDLLRGEAEPKVEMAAGFPEQFVPISRTNNAGLYRQEKLK